MHPADANDLTRYIKQLSKSQKGRNAIRHILTWLDDDGLALDYANQDAIVGVIWMAWKYPGSTRDAMRQAIGGK
jgi:membrane protein required for beta-lactamase induction